MGKQVHVWEVRYWIDNTPDYPHPKMREYVPTVTRDPRAALAVFDLMVQRRGTKVWHISSVTYINQFMDNTWDPDSAWHV